MSKNKKSVIDEMQEMQTIILKKIQALNDLNVQYKDRQEKHFLKTFIHVMDKISNQLLLAEQKYMNIDKQIQKDQKCIKLASQLKFFKQECIQLRKQLKQTKQQLALEKKKKQSLVKEKQAINDSLIRKQKQASKYKIKLLNFSKQFQNQQIYQRNKIQFRLRNKKQYSNTPKQVSSIDNKQCLEERPKLHTSQLKGVRDRIEQISGKNRKKFMKSLISTSHGLQQDKKRKLYI